MHRSKKATFAYIKEKVHKKLQGWKRNMLLAGGRFVLIKAVGEAIPIYSLACFKLPDTLLDELHKMMVNFWWGQRTNERKMIWESWNKLCQRKCKGGLAFEDLKAMNLALLTKQQCWRLVSDQISPFYKIFRGKYFRNGDILSVELGPNPSWGWRSILEGRKVIEKGLRWNLGNGNCVKVYQDPWLPIDYPFTVPREIPQDPSIFLAKNLFLEHGNWNEELVRAKFPANIADRNLALQPSTSDDELVWSPNNGGKYTVASGYKVAFNCFHPLQKSCLIT